MSQFSAIHYRKSAKHNVKVSVDPYENSNLRCKKCVGEVSAVRLPEKMSLEMNNLATDRKIIFGRKKVDQAQFAP